MISMEAGFTIALIRWIARDKGNVAVTVTY
jgi:hypothetical protein